MVSFEKYPEYQATKYLWIGDLPKNWGVRRLKEVGRLFGGAGFPHEYQNVQGEELYFYKVGDLSLSENGKTLLASPHTISKETAQVLRATIVPKSAIVYAKIGAALLLNRRRMTTASCCIDNNMTAYVVDSEKVIPEWAFYWLSTIDFGEHVNPGAVPSFSEGYQSVLPLPVPPLDEQRTITIFLDYKTSQIDALIAKKQMLLEKLAEKRTALISHAVTKGLDPSAPMKDSGVAWLGEIPAHWNSSKIRFVSTKIEQGWSPQCNNQPADIEQWGVLKVGCVNGEHFDENENKALPDDLEPKLHYQIKSGDILVSRANTKELLGSAALVMDVRPRLILCDKLYRITPNSLVDSNYLVRFLRSSVARFQYERNATGTSGSMQNIGQDTLKDLPFPLPPLKEQSQISEYLHNVFSKIAATELKITTVIEKLKEYRSALITNAVTGKIDLRIWQAPKETA